eukprot:SAG22_NODE_616_length_8539_cov_5.330213_5_plen_332_part_00
MIVKQCHDELLAAKQWADAGDEDDKQDYEYEKESLPYIIEFMLEQAGIHRLLDYTDIILRSDKGTGKTYSFARHAKENSLTFLSIVALQSLAKTQYNDWVSQDKGHELDVVHYEDMDPFYIMKGCSAQMDTSLIITLNSLDTKLPVATQMDWSRTVVYLDECEFLLRYLVTASPLDKKRTRVWHYLVHILKHCRQVIATDADVTDKVQMFFTSNGIDREFKVIGNQHQSNHNVLAEEVTSKDDLVDRMHKTEKWLCCTDSKANAELLHKEFPDAVLIVADGRKFAELADFDDPKNKRIIYSPKVVNGIDSQVRRQVFCLYHERSIGPEGML